METPDSQELTQVSDSTTEQFQQKLAEVFSGYRAEWLGAEVFRLFTKPSYFPQLLTSHPCFLVGGRGTGKTTTLRCLSYQGQAALRANSTSFVDSPSWPFVGLYYRVNTNRVRAFGGPEMAEHSWLRLFGHYVNLELSDLVLRFLQWHAQHYPSAEVIGKRSLLEFAASMHLANCTNIDDAVNLLNMSRLRFEAMINNVADCDRASLSLQGAPIDGLLTAVKALPHFANTSFARATGMSRTRIARGIEELRSEDPLDAGRTRRAGGGRKRIVDTDPTLVFFLLDEYENFDSPQQRVVNTLIKHCGELYSFKVGVREFGDSQRATLNEHEKLRHPADYKRIDLSTALHRRFSEFAARVCRQRLKSVFGSQEWDIKRLFPVLT